MKKNILKNVTVCALTAALGLGALGALAATTSRIDLDRAKVIALEHAGFAAKEVKFVEAKRDREDGRLVYEIEFYAENLEYDYEIDAESGEILEYDYDAEHYSVKEASGQDIGLEQAKAAALKHAGLKETEVTFEKAKRSREDGLLVYDIEFYTEEAEYDYEIDLETGKVLEFDREIERNSSAAAAQNPSDGSVIGEAKAKEAALKHAGLKESQIRRYQCELEWDDGRQVYEIEFKSGGMEYEYEIGAADGKVLSFEQEDDD